jgi:hypothetical protein
MILTCDGHAFCRRGRGRYAKCLSPLPSPRHAARRREAGTNSVLLRALEAKLDRRLARSTRDLLNVLDAVAKAGAGFRSFKG